MACRWIVGIAKIFTNDGMEPKEITNIEIYRPKFILKRHALFMHVVYKEHFTDMVSHLTQGTYAWNTVVVVSVLDRGLSVKITALL